MLDKARKVQTFFIKGLLQSVDEFSAEYLLEHFQGQEECGRATYPACAAGRQTSRWDDTMDMRMKQEILAPSMQDRCAARVLTTAPGSKHTLDRNSKEFT